MAGTNRRTTTGKRTGSGKKPGRKPAGRRFLWLGLGAGFAVGVLVTFLMQLTPGVQPQADKPAPLVSQQESDKGQKEPIFDFYTLLPESESIAHSGKKTAPEQSKKPPAAVKPRPSVAHKKEAAEKAIFLLQAGSFRSAKDADRLRAQLILSGFDARVQKVSVRGGEQWHRVQLGPYTNAVVSQVRAKLAVQGMETLLMKQR